MRPVYKIGLLVALIAVLGAICAAVYMYYLGQEDMSSSKPDFVVTATDLQKEFEQDEAAATTKYTNRIIEVSGTVTSVTKAEGGKTNISLSTASDLSSVICTFPGDFSPLPASGDKITVRGECSGFLMDVLLNNCVIIKQGR